MILLSTLAPTVSCSRTLQQSLNYRLRQASAGQSQVTDQAERAKHINPARGGAPKRGRPPLPPLSREVTHTDGHTRPSGGEAEAPPDLKAAEVQQQNIQDLRHRREEAKKAAAALKRFMERTEEAAEREAKNELERWSEAERRLAEDGKAKGQPAHGKGCPKGCEGRGTCQQDVGRCDCPPHLTGAACESPARPNCVVRKGYELRCDLPSLPCECYLDCIASLGRVGAAVPPFCFNVSTSAVLLTGEESLLNAPIVPVHQGKLEEYHDAQPATRRSVSQCVLSAEQTCVRAPWATAPQHPTNQSQNSCADPGCVAELRKVHAALRASSYIANTNETAYRWDGPLGHLRKNLNGGCNSPSERGVCSAGTCVCHLRFYGSDCSLSAGPGGAELLWGKAPRRRAAIPSPRIYVYHLPPRFNTYLLPPSSYRIAADARLASVFLLDRLLGSKHRTSNASEAEYFFLGLPMAGFLDSAGVEEAIRYVREVYPYWNKTEGADHILVATDDEGGCSGEVRC
eukprot:gene2254-2971_t